jgi:hypothetical protein
MTPPIPEPIRFETLLSLSWTVFRRNWIVALPPVIAMGLIVAGYAAFISLLIVGTLAHGGMENASPSFGGALVIAAVLFIVAAFVVILWSYAAMYGMADAAWAKGTTTFADGFTAFRTRAGALIVAGIGVIGIAIAAVILALPTLGLAILALPLVTMYIAPSVVTGGRDGFTAIAESFRLVRRFFGTSAIALLVLLGIHYGISMLASFSILPFEFAILPTLGQTTAPHFPPISVMVLAGLWFILALLAAQAYTGFYTIAIVGLYRSLYAQPSAAPPLGRF